MKGLLWKAETKRARVIVGATPGKLGCWSTRSHAKRCSSLGPDGPKAEVFDSFVMRRRGRQIGAENVGLTRYSTRGVYQGGGERSFVYDIIDDGSDGGRFKKNMENLAEALSKRFCQDEVLVEHIQPNGDVETRSYRTDSCSTK